MRTFLVVILTTTNASIASAQSPVVATVDGHAIRLEAVDSILKRRPPIDGPLTAAETHHLRSAILDDLIDDHLLERFLTKTAPPVPPADLERYRDGVVAALKKQGKTLADVLRETRQTEAELRASWTTALQFQRLVDAKATDEQLRAYFTTHRPVFENATVRVSHVVVRIRPDAPPTERAAAREKLTAVRADVVAGRLTFAAAAKQFSVCPSAAKGGDLGWISRKDTTVDDALAAVAFDLKPSDVSPPVDTEFGVHLVTVTARNAGTPTTFERAKDAVKDLYAEDVRQSLVSKLRKQAAITITLP